VATAGALIGGREQKSAGSLIILRPDQVKVDFNGGVCRRTCAWGCDVELIELELQS
jgi:hypothetical protein